MYHLSGNVIFATVSRVYINLQPEYELLARLVLGAPSSRAIPKEKLSARGPSSCSWLPERQI